MKKAKNLKRKTFFDCKSTGVKLAIRFPIYFALVILFGCNNLKYLQDGEKLYTGASVKIISEHELKGEKLIAKQAKKAIKPSPNGKILGLRVKLWIYNKAPNTTKETGFKHWLKYEVGEPPVLLSDVKPTATSEFIHANVFNKGFFKANVSFVIVEDKNNKKAAIEYRVFVNKPFTIHALEYSSMADTGIRHIVTTTMKNSLLKIGMAYDLELLRAERTRIDNELKNSGYYYFSPDYFYFKIDSSSKDNYLDITLDIKPKTPAKALIPYRMSTILVFVDSSDNDRNFIHHADTVKKNDSITFVKSNPNFRRKPITNCIFLKVGGLYSREQHNQTLSRINSLGVFKFVNMRIAEDSTRPNYLTANIELNPVPEHGITAEFEAATKSNNFIGPSVNLGYTNRNLFRGAERLNISIRGSIETQFNGRLRGLYTYEVGPQIKYSLPRFLLPFRARVPKLSAPVTQFSLDFTHSKRIDYFDLNSLKFMLEYRWKESVTKEHIVSPLNATYLNINNISTAFDNVLIANPFLRQRYDDQLIAGLTYSFTYNEQVYEGKKNQLYFNGNADIAGNTLALLSSLANANSNEFPRQFAGVNYAQYLRFDVDVRDYVNFKAKSKFASRVIVGIGIPYENSAALPYIKGFFSGGTNSIRAFPINSVGPGTYHLPDSLADSFILQQGGDIKLEWSGEYRFPIIAFMHGAFFVDAGNTWLVRNNPLLPGGQFNINSFYKQLAIGTGFGLRADFNFFVIRLDLGIPVRKPWLNAGEDWVITKIEPSNGSWRAQNLVLNIAIGYPF